MQLTGPCQAMSDRPRLHANLISNTTTNALPVVFLHGFGGVGAQWWGLQTAISFKAPTISFDLPGHGKSVSFPNAGPPKVAADAVLAELDALGHERFHLVGHSMGGAISSIIALKAPNRVASMLLLAPGGYGEEFNHPLLLKWAAAKNRDELADVLPHFFGPTYEMPEKVIDYQVSTRQTPGLSGSLQSIAKAMSSDGKQGVLPVDDVLSTGVPISVVWGREDAVLPVSQTDQLIGRVDLHLLDDVGHSPAEEATELVQKLIMDRLAAA